MNIAIASDHRGLELLEVVRSELASQDHEVEVLGMTGLEGFLLKGGVIIDVIRLHARSRS